MKKELLLFIAMLIAGQIACAQITPADCGNGNVYQVTNGSTTTNSTLWVYNPILGTRTSLGTLPGYVNAIGRNTVDNFLWGTVSGNKIVKIGTNANWEEYTIPNLPTGGFWNTGTISTDGYYYLTTTSNSRYYTIDLDPTRSTYLQLVDPTAGFVLDNTAPFGTAMSPARDISDWSFNPVDGQLYALINTDNPDQYHVMVFNPATGTSTLSPSAVTGGSIEGSDYGGAYFDAEGNFYVIRNESGHFYRINLSTYAATRISGFSVTGVQFNDAAACGNAPQIPTDLGDAPDSYGTLFNSGGAVHIVSGDLMIGSAVDAEDEGFPSLAANGDDDDQSPDDEDGVGSIPPLFNDATSYSFKVIVTNTSGAPAILAGWIDFNNDGAFQSSERAEVAVAAGQTSVIINWTGLSGIVASNSYMRLRIAADGNDILNATGPAGTGEVEDYPFHITAMPVKLKAFDVHSENGAVLLTWATTEESNADRFDIQRSTNGRTWEVIGSQKAKGESSILVNYAFSDQSPIPAASYYRLKMIDLDDTFAYSRIRNVTFSGVKARLYPNPAAVKLHIDDANAARLNKVIIYSKSGIAVYSKQGANQSEIDLSGLRAGSYIVTLFYNDGSQASQTIVKY